MGARNADPSKIPYPKKGDLVSLRQFAALVGVDYNSARVALENGRIRFVGNTRKLDFHEQLKCFQDTRTHRYIVDDNGAKDVKGLTPLGKAKLRKEVAVAEQKELELAVLKDKYLEKSAVTEAVYDFARDVRDALLMIPERISSRIAAEVQTLYDSARDAKTRGADIERIVNATWAEETRIVLNALAKPPKIKNKKEAAPVDNE